MGETSAEAKRQVDETRAHLRQTVEALELKTRHNLDLGRRLRQHRGVQAMAGLTLIGLGALAVLVILDRRRRSPAERLVRRLKLEELRDRLGDFSEDARAWAAAQRRILRADRKGKPAETAPRERLVRRLLVSAAEAALTAAAAGLVRRVLSPPSPPHGDRAASSKSR